MDPLARLKDLAISESGFVFDPWTGATFSVNAVGKAILEGLRNGLDPDGVARQLAERFESADGDDPARDVQEYLIMLRDNGLVPRDAKP